jgi:formate C-acetyltransferase
VTESIGGMGDDGRSLVTKTSFRMLQTLYNLGPAPEPESHDLVLGADAGRLPDVRGEGGHRHQLAQFESDEIMRRTWGDDGAIACCVSPMLVGKQMQFFGARANLAKCLLYAINGGRDEMSGKQVGPASEPVKGEYLDFDEVVERFAKMMDWLAGVYVNAMNVIHYMHDKYAYERVEMALHDYAPVRTMAFGMAGLSVVADSLSAIKYAKVKVDPTTTGSSSTTRPKVSSRLREQRQPRRPASRTWVVSTFMSKLRKHPTYRNALHTQSILTITSNVVYGKATGNTPDGRRKGEPFAPGANPMHGRDTHGIHCVGGVGREDSVPRRRGRHLADRDAGADRALGGFPRTRSRTSPRFWTRIHGDRLTT